MGWLIEGREVVPSDVEGFSSFVYRITNLLDDRIYIGKKQLESVRRTRKKGRKNRVVKRSASDWETYWSSSKELQEDVEKLGEENFRREIIRLCRTKSEATYYEAKFQFDLDLMLRQETTYNRWIMCRVRPFKL